VSSWIKTLCTLQEQLVLYAAQEKMDVPKHRYDGEDADEHEVALVLGIPLAEATYRLKGLDGLRELQRKDIYAGLASQQIPVTMTASRPTIYERMAVLRSRPKKKRKRRKTDDGSTGN